MAAGCQVTGRDPNGSGDECADCDILASRPLRVRLIYCSVAKIIEENEQLNNMRSAHTKTSVALGAVLLNNTEFDLWPNPGRARKASTTF